jgi:hypothetical protein
MASFEARLNALLSRWEESGRRGQTIAVEALCRDCPEVVDHGVEHFVQ